MSINVELNIKQGEDYKPLYPKTLGTLVEGSVSSADSLSTVLGIDKGGTGDTTASKGLGKLIMETRVKTPGDASIFPFSSNSLGYRISGKNLKDYLFKGKGEAIIGNYVGNGESLVISYDRTIKDTINMIVITSKELNIQHENFGSLILPIIIIKDAPIRLNFTKGNTSLSMASFEIEGLDIKIGYSTGSVVDFLNKTGVQYYYILI